MEKKIKMLVIPSDRQGGVGKFRSIQPHVYLQEHYKDDFDIDIVFDLPKDNLEEFLRQYDLIHIHKQLDREGKIMDMIKFLGIPIIVDIDDHFKLGEDHPMSLTAKKEKWHEPIINHLKKADYVTTTTQIFADIIKKYNKNVAVLPNAIDPEEKQFSRNKNFDDNDGKLRVGLICGSTHLKDIQPLRGLCSLVRPNVQLYLCGFDTNGTRTIYHQDTGQVERRPITPEESVWYEYEKILTDNYKTISKEHKDFLLKFMKVDDPFVNENYRRMWTRNINEYATHYQNIDLLLAPLKENDFDLMKCIVGDSLVSTNKGIFKISDIVENKLQLKTDNDFNVVNYFKYENEATVKIKTKMGYELEGTPTHRIKINNEWKMLGDLNINDKIDLSSPKLNENIPYQKLYYPMLITKNTDNKFEKATETMMPSITVNEEWGRLFGYLLGDGNFTYHGFGISCDSRYEDVVQDVDNLIVSAGLHAVHAPKKVDKRCKKNLSKYGFGIDLKVTSNTFSKLCVKYNLFGEGGKRFVVPDFILKSPKSVIKEFLRGLFEADGTVGEENGVSFATKSLKLAQQIQYLLLGFGLTCRLNRKYNKHYNKYYYYLDLRKEESIIFKNEIGFVSSEKNRKLKVFTDGKNGNNTHKMEFCDEIIEIENNVNDVYDIEVENVHEFNSNGIISHNSQLKVIEAGFTDTAIIAQDFGPYQIDIKPMFEFGGKINEDGNGILVKSAKNHKDWVKYINRLADDLSLVRKLKDNLYNTVKDKYSLEAVSKERVKLYKELVNKNGQE